MKNNKFEPQYYEFIQIKNHFDYLKSYAIPQKAISHEDKEWIRATYSKIICTDVRMSDCVSCALSQWWKMIEYFVNNYTPPYETYSTSNVFVPATVVGISGTNAYSTSVAEVPSHLTDEALNIKPIHSEDKSFIKEIPKHYVKYEEGMSVVGVELIKDASDPFVIGELPEDVKNKIKNERPTITKDLNTPTGDGKVRTGKRKNTGESGRL